MSIGKNLREILKKIEATAFASGRDPHSVRLLAVSKLQSPQKIMEAYHDGQRVFGENYVQEALPKMGRLSPQEIEWHFIGQLQSNKAKQVVGVFDLIQSVDRISLAEEISKRGVTEEIRQGILLQVNIGGESTKGGAGVDEMMSLAQEVVKLPGVIVHGLMVMPPLTSSAQEAREFFRQTRELGEKIRTSLPADVLGLHPMNELSMGTSSDFEAAIQEGSTMVRIGTDIFGQREIGKENTGEEKQ